jgi:hypothetical protein
MRSLSRILSSTLKVSDLKGGTHIHPNLQMHPANGGVIEFPVFWLRAFYRLGISEN